MAESYGFFNYDQNVFNSTGEYDRSYDAEEFCQYFALFIGNGVFANPMNQLKVNSAITTSTPFNVVVTAGWAFIEGHWYHNDASKTITIPANTSSNAVWHRICVRLNKQARTISLVDIQQAPSTPPTNTNAYHDLVLAEIQVRANANKLYASDIADTRANETKCGFVAGVIDQIDAEGMFNQLEAQFNEWFNNIKNQFGSDPVGEISQDILTLQKNVSNLQSSVSDLGSDIGKLEDGQQQQSQGISELQDDMSTVEYDLSGLESTVTALSNNVQTLQNKISLLPNTKWFLFGDSLAAIDGGYRTLLKQWMGDRFNYLAQGSMKYGTNAVSGYYIFTNQLDSWLPTIQNKNTYSDVFVELGSNDVVEYNSSNFISGFNSAISKIKSNFPNARIHIGIVGKQMLESIYNTRQIVINALKKQCGENGCLWAYGNENILGGKAQTFDTIHPTEEGHKYIARALYSYMNGGGIIPATLARNTVSSGIQGLQIQEWYEDGKYMVKVAGTISNSRGFSIPGELGVIGTKIGDCSLNYCYRNVEVSGWLQARITVFGTMVMHHIPCTIVIVPSDSASTTCGVYIVASYRDYYRDANGATQLWTDGFTFTDGIFNGPPTTIPA